MRPRPRRRLSMMTLLLFVVEDRLQTSVHAVRAGVERKRVEVVEVVNHE